MSDETFDVWPHDPTEIVKEALREYVGDGDGEDERVLAAHEESVRAEERERIARNIEGQRITPYHGSFLGEDDRGWNRAVEQAARIARKGA